MLYLIIYHILYHMFHNISALSLHFHFHTVLKTTKIPYCKQNIYKTEICDAVVSSPIPLISEHNILIYH